MSEWKKSLEKKIEELGDAVALSDDNKIRETADAIHRMIEIRDKALGLKPTTSQ